MNLSIRTTSRFTSLVVTALISTASLLFASPRTVKVAYFEAANFQKGDSSTVIKTGYSYEYLQYISNFTGWEYEYVYGDWETLYKMFLNGEIDLFAGIDLDPALSKKFFYPDYYMSANRDYIYVPSENSTITKDDLSSLNGKKIGCVLNHTITKSFKQWMIQNNVHAELVPYNDFDNLSIALKSGSVDAFISADKYVNITPILRAEIAFAEGKSCLCTRLGATDVYNELLYAQKQIYEFHPEILSELSSVYFRNIETNITLSDTELEWLDNNKILKIGYVNDYYPFCNMDSDGNVCGILKDIVDVLIEKMVLSEKLKVEYHVYQNTNELQNALKNDEVDVVFPETKSHWYSESNNLITTSKILDVPMAAVFSGEFSDHVFDSIAVTHRPLQVIYVNNFFPESKLVTVTNGVSCVDAVLEGKASCTILSIFRITPLIQELKYSPLRIMPLENELSYCFGVKKGNVGLVSLLNRGIEMVDSSYLMNKAYSYIENDKHYSLREFLHDNIVLIFFVFVVIVGIIAFLIVWEFKKDKKYIQELEAAQKTGYQKARKFFDCFIGTYFATFYLNLTNGTYISFSKEKKELNEIEGFPKYYNTASGKWEIINRYIDECVHNDDKEKMYEAVKPEYIRQRLKLEPRFIVLMRDITEGNEKWFRFEAMRAEDENFAAIAISDVTSIKLEEDRQQRQLTEAYQMAQTANKAKETFLNNMSHDIRTPMNAIIGFTNLATKHIDNRSLAIDYLKKISISSDHLLTLINDILDMSLIETGKVKIEEKEMCLPEMLQDLKSIVQPIISEKKLNFYIDTEDVIDEVIMADKVRLNQVLLNIIGNAVKFTMEGGNVSIRIIQKPYSIDGYADYEFHVKDTGIGISKEFQDHVFEAFSRESTSTVSGIQGTGLGMAITKNIVDMMGGKIKVDSEVGRGSDFIVSLRFKLCNETPKYNALPQLKGRRALIVDDDINTCTSVTKVLKTLGLRTESTTSGKEAVLKAKLAKEVNDEFHVYIVDWIMPEMAGSGTIRKLRDIAGDDKPIYVISAYDTSDIDADAREVGATEILSKPVFINDFKQLLTDPASLSREEEDEEKLESVDFKGKKVLLVEDNELNQEIAKTILEECGFTVEVVNDGLFAVQKIFEAEPNLYDIILMDIQMPKMNGYDATKQIRKMNNGYENIPIIAMTANAFEDDIKAAMQAGMDSHVAKPINVQELLLKMEVLLRK